MHIVKQIAIRSDGGTNVFYSHEGAVILKLVYVKEVFTVTKYVDNLLRNLGYSIEEVE